MAKRSGGSGLGGTAKGSKRQPSLRQQFNYYKRQYRNRLIDEQAFVEARAGFSFSGRPSTLFKNLDYDKLMTEGTSRKVGNKTVYIKGEEAVLLQIQSLRERASKSFQSQLYIDNYLGALRSVGMSEDKVESISKAFNRIGLDMLAILIDKNILPQIYFLYSEEEDEDELYTHIKDTIRLGVSYKELTEVRERKKILKPLIKQKFDIMGW